MATLVDFDTHSAAATGSGLTIGNRVTSGVDQVVESFTIRVTSSGTFTVKVWDMAGNELGSGSATGSGTFQVSLTTPVELAASTDYILSAYGGSPSIFITDPGLADHSHSSGSFSFTQTEVRYDSGDVFPTTVDTRCATISPHVSAAGITVALTPAVETDSAPAIGRVKRKAIATVTETDGAQALSRQKQRALQPATETDTAVPFPTAIIVALATVTETSEARPITRNTDALRYRVIFPTYPRTFQSVPIGQTARFVLDQAVSIVRINGTLRQFRNPSQTMLEAAGTEGQDWFIGGHVYDEISYETHLELQAAGFETEAVA